MSSKKRRKRRKLIPIPLLVAIDIVLIACTLLIYALFQHVIPAYRADGEEGVVLSDSDDSEDLIWAEKFAEHFSDEVIITDTGYSSPHISVELRDISDNWSTDTVAQHVLVEDIYISGISFFQTWADGGKYSTAVNGIVQLSEQSGAVAAINGDYAAFNSTGYVVRNGVLYRQTQSLADVCALYEDGRMETYSSGTFDIETAENEGVWQVWTFGPSLLNEDGTAREDFTSFYSSVSAVNPRTAIGYYEPGHYCFVVADGRQSKATGFTLPELAKVMEGLGCKTAYNLDGGASAQMTLNEDLVSIPTNGRRVVNDILIIREEKAGENQ